MWNAPRVTGPQINGGIAELRTHLKLATSIVILALFVSVGAIGRVEAHEGEDHGTPEPVVAMPGEALLAAVGEGAAFDAILKYRPFEKGEQVAITLYLASSETNRPVSDASISGSLSDGENTTTIAFRAKEGGPPGAYSATATPGSDSAMSWLFDITAGSDSDLIAISGFKAGTNLSAPTVGATHSHAHASSPPLIAVLVSLGVLLATAAFVAGRVTARKVVSA